MHLWLRRIGYRPYFSGIGRNVDCPELLTQRLLMTIEQAHGETGQKVTLVGHSLGGMLSRAAAHYACGTRIVIASGTASNRIGSCPRISPSTWTHGWLSGCPTAVRLGALT